MDQTCAIEKLTTIDKVRAVLKEEVNRRFKPFALPKPYRSTKDVFCLREKRMVNGYRKISLYIPALTCEPAVK